MGEICDQTYQAQIFGQHKIMQKTCKMIETLAYGYSSDRSRRELSDEYQQDRVSMEWLS